MNKAKFLVAIIAVFIGISGLTFFAAQQYHHPTATSAGQVLSLIKKPSVLVQSSSDKKTIKLAGRDGKNALALLSAGAQVKTEQSSSGEFVTVINGIEADGINRFWAFYVNDELADESAGTYITKSGDHIEFRVEDVQ
jgi:hypothetical protein